MPRYDSPAIIILGNGIKTFECLASDFRLDPDAQDSDFPNFNPEDPRSKISPDCEEESLDFAISLDEMGAHSEVLENYPDWLLKNLVTTVDQSDCKPETSRKRQKRDAFDDKSACGGPCEVLWNCANHPNSTLCEEPEIFANCFDRENPFAFKEPCITVHSCINGPIKLPESCGTYVKCMSIDFHMDPTCIDVLTCFKDLSKSTQLCYNIYQCLEDQIEHKCEEVVATTDDYLLGRGQTEEQIQTACNQLDDIISEEPSIAGVSSDPLRLIILKGPAEYATRGFMFASFRLVQKIFQYLPELNWNWFQEPQV